MSGRSSVVESLLPKQVVVGSNPIARSKFIRDTSALSMMIGLASRNGSRSFFVFPARCHMQTRTVIFSAVIWVASFSGCHYCEEYRVLKSTADIQDERAELLKAYRLCLAKYQEEPPKAKEMCAPYTQSLRELEVRHQPVR